MILLTCILTALLGYWLAGKVGMPKWEGAVIGFFTHLVGCVVLAVIWRHEVAKGKAK